jgi:hypothetical protein
MSEVVKLFEPFPKQQEFIEAALGDEFDFILYGGAIRGGKTFGGLAALILLSRFFKGSRWAVVRKDLPTLKRTTIPSFKKIVPTNFLLGGSLATGYNQTDQVVTFKNGSQIIFFPENFVEDKELNRWKGLEVNGFLLEEINELHEDSFTKAQERAGTWLIRDAAVQPPIKILATCNPAQNWVKSKIYDAWKGARLPQGWKYIPSRIFDNPHIPKEYVDGLKRLPRYQYEVFVLGNWEVKLRTGLEFYKSFNPDVHVKVTRYDRNLPLHISFDENSNPYLPCTIWQGQGLKLWQIDEITCPPPNNTLADICAEISRRYKFHTSGVYIYGDATSKKSDTKIEKGSNFFKLAAKNLSRFAPTLRVPKANPPVAMRASFINAIFEVKAEGCEVVVASHCRKTVNDLLAIYETSEGTKLKVKEKDPKTGVTFEPFGHLSDSLDYVVCEYFKSEFRAYQGSPVIDAERRSLGQRKIKRSY